MEAVVSVESFVSAYQIDGGSSVGGTATGRSRDRVPVRVKFFLSVHSDPKAYPASCTMGTGVFSRCKAARAWCSPPTSFQRRSCQRVGAVPSCLLCACTDMSQGDVELFANLHGLRDFHAYYTGT
jgi:hypothetical protein